MSPLICRGQRGYRALMRVFVVPMPNIIEDHAAGELVEEGRDWDIAVNDILVRASKAY